MDELAEQSNLPLPVGEDETGFGLVLGGGGARGLAHVLMLEALDELGIKPSIIAGTSIGSLMGAAYASGMSGAEIRAYCQELFEKRIEVVRRLFPNWNSGIALFRGSEGGFGLPFSGETTIKALLPERVPQDFAALGIPLLVVTTDFYAQSQHVIRQGALRPAIAASSALPGVFRPVELDERVLIDGGFVNPTPFDLLLGKASIVAAIDVTAGVQPSRGKAPSLIETIIGATQITLRSVLREKLKAEAPHILIRPELAGFGVLDFFKIEEIFAAAEPAKDDFKRQCEAAIAGTG